MADLPERGLLAPQAIELPAGEAGVHITLRGKVHLLGGDSKTAYVKLLPLRRLVNELVGSQLARSLGLLAPQPYLVRIDAADYGDLFTRSGYQGKHALGFGTEAIAGNPLSKTLNLDDPVHAELFFKYLKQWQPLCAFDSWIGNEDRHAANIVLDSSFHVWAIDHDRSLGTDTPYSSLDATVPRRNRFLSEHGEKLPLRLKHEASDVAQELMKRARVLDVAGEVSDSSVTSCLTSPEVDSLVLYVENRLGMVDALICEALGIPKLLS